MIKNHHAVARSLFALLNCFLMLLSFTALAFDHSAPRTQLTSSESAPPWKLDPLKFVHSSSDKSTLGVLDFTPNGTQPGLLSAIDGNEACSNCHTGGTDDETQMAYPTWSGSMMANAARDPMFWAAVDVANRDVPGVGDYSIRCHAPNAWLSGCVMMVVVALSTVRMVAYYRVTTIISTAKAMIIPA